MEKRARDLEQDLALCEKATPGPWKITHRPGFESFAAFIELENTLPGRPDENIVAATMGASQEEANNDARFIAAAREALPYWLGEVKRLREGIAGLQEALGGEEVADWAVEAVECRRETADANIERIRLDKENKKLRAENERLQDCITNPFTAGAGKRIKAMEAEVLVAFGNDPMHPKKASTLNSLHSAIDVLRAYTGKYADGQIRSRYHNDGGS